METINKVEFRIVSLARSGHHGIINWIIGQCPGKVCYLNGAKPGRDPYLTYVSKDLKNINEEEFLKNRDKNKKTLKKDYLIYSYEELPLREVFSEDSESCHDKFLGKSLTRYDILILRDPYNYFASRLKLEEMGLYDPNIRIKLTNKKSREILSESWIQYAKEFLGKSSYLKYNKVVINFDKWVLDKSYRQELSKKLNLEFSDVRMNKLTRAGPGSSFDKLKYADDGAKMKVLERWKVMKDYPFYRDIFKNKEIVELGSKIFGELPGTKVLSERQGILNEIWYTIKLNKLFLIGKIKHIIKKIYFPIRKMVGG